MTSEQRPGVVPVTTIENPLLSDKQKELLGSVTRMYLKDHKLVITKPVFVAATQVLEDAIYRGLTEQGRILYGEKENLRPLIKEGLAVRDGIKTQSAAVIDYSEYNHTTSEQYVGPYALPVLTVTKAKRELATFPLSPSLSESEKAIKIAQERDPLINKFAGIALAHLPEQLQGVFLEQFPDISERAKLARNMITSFAFRHELSPLIPTDDLKMFQHMEQVAENSYFSPEMTQALIQELSLSEKEQEFLKALIEQAASGFRIAPEVDENTPSAIDRFYNVFSNNLLILHPVLEEGAIRTRVDKIQESDQHLWEDGIRFDNFLVPTPEMLAKAARQATIKHDEKEIDRMKLGIHYWNDYERELQWKENRTRTLEQSVQATESVLARVFDPEFTIPESVQKAGTDVERRVNVRLRASKREAATIDRIMTDYVANQRELKTYEEWSKSHDEEAQFPVTRGRYIQRLHHEASTMEGRGISLNRQIAFVEDVVMTHYQPDNTQEKDQYIFFRAEKSKKAVANELQQVEKQLQKYEEDPEKYIEAHNGVDTLFDELDRFLENSHNAIVTESRLLSTVRFSTSLKSLRSRSSKIISPRTKQRFVRETIPLFLQRKIHFLKQGLSLKETLETTKRNQRAALQLVKEYTSNPDKPVPSTETWGRNEIDLYIRGLQASQLPTSTDTPLFALKQYAKLLRQQLRAGSLDIIPMNVSSIREYIENLDKIIATAQVEITERQERMKTSKKNDEDDKYIARRQRKIKHIQDSQENLFNNPLFPYPEYEYLPRNEFVRAWINRADAAYAFTNLHDVTENATNAEKTRDTLNREKYDRMLRKEIKQYKGKLEAVRNVDAGQNLVKAMRTIGLAMPISPTETQNETTN